METPSSTMTGQNTQPMLKDVATTPLFTAEKTPSRITSWPKRWLPRWTFVNLLRPSFTSGFQMLLKRLRARPRPRNSATVTSILDTGCWSEGQSDATFASVPCCTPTCLGSMNQWKSRSRQADVLLQAQTTLPCLHGTRLLLSMERKPRGVVLEWRRSLHSRRCSRRSWEGTPVQLTTTGDVLEGVQEKVRCQGNCTGWIGLATWQSVQLYHVPGNQPQQWRSNVKTGQCWLARCQVSSTFSKILAMLRFFCNVCVFVYVADCL